jgi:hypothetical protein
MNYCGKLDFLRHGSQKQRVPLIQYQSLHQNLKYRCPAKFFVWKRSVYSQTNKNMAD